MDIRSARIFVAGHAGLAGSAVVRCLRRHGATDLILREHKDLELTDGAAVEEFFRQERPEAVVLCAARVGGIVANIELPAELIHCNLVLQGTVMDAARRADVKRLVFLGSSCIYPRECPQPIKESYLLSGPLEGTNRPYAVAKIAGIETCWAYNRQYGSRYVALMPTNLYGPRDNYHEEHSHVLAALLRRFHGAKCERHPEVTVWGSGTVYREFMHSDDLGAAVACVMSLDDADLDRLVLGEDGPPLLNVGFGTDLTIADLARMVAQTVGYDGRIVWDRNRPDGTPRKLLDSSAMRALGWAPAVELEDGLRRTYLDFKAEHPNL